MSKFNEHIEKCLASAKELNLKIDPSLLEKVAKGLGPAIYNKDASMVSCSDPKELQRVKENFLMGKLGLKDGQELDGVIERVCGDMKGNRTKWRAVFYTILVQKLNAQSSF